MTIEQLKSNKVLRGPIFPEPVQVILTIPMGSAVKLVAKGLNTGKVYEPVLTPEKLALLETSALRPPPNLGGGAGWVYAARACSSPSSRQVFQRSLRPR